MRFRFARTPGSLPAQADAPAPRVASAGTPPGAPAAGEGTLCLEAGCTRTDAVACHYMDRRGRICDTDWCSTHLHAVAGNGYCQRHAGVMRALTLSSLKGHLPDVDNRAPSLANWVGNDLDVGIRQILDGVRQERAGEKIIVEPVGYVFTVRNKAHIWQRAWKLASHTGITLKVAIDVDEANDAIVMVSVGGRAVRSTVPPWVEHHRMGKNPDATTDARERREFYAGMLAVIRDEVAKERRGGPDAPYIGPLGVDAPTA